MSRFVIRLLSVLNILVFLGVVAVNGLANALPINGRNTGEISDSLPNLFVPAGITFSIWGVIYLLLGIWSVWQLVAALGGRAAGTGVVEKIGIWFIISCLANIAWILCWHYGRYTLSLLVMLVLLISLIVLYLRLDIGRANLGTARNFASHLPFSIYLGWITVATVANVTAVLVNAGWNGFGIPEAVWAILVIAVAAVITLVMLVNRADIGYAVVVLWALFGIVLARLNGPVPSVPVAIGAVASGGVVLAGVVWRLINRNS
jgi:hypothetical protein